MNCREAQGWIGGSDANASLPADIRAHLSDCSRCRQYAEETKKGDAWIATMSRASIEEPDMEKALSRLHQSLSTESRPQPAISSVFSRFNRRKEYEMLNEGTQIQAGTGSNTRRASLKWVTALTLAVVMGGGAGYWVSQPKNEGVAAANGKETLSPEQVKAAGEISLNHLKQLGLAFFTYSQSVPSKEGERTPPMSDPETAKAALLPFVEGNADLFVSPMTGKPYQPNPNVGNREIGSFPSPAETVTFYEAETGPDGMHRVVFVDGHVDTLSAEQWEQLKESSKIP